jgi:4-hydroxybenzoate polyprenyltransferase
LALAHLGVNDLADVVNDQAKGLNTIPTLYGMKATAYWVVAFTIFHLVVAAVFLTVIGLWAIIGFAVSFALLTFGDVIILKGKSAQAAIKALPMFHLSMLIYAISVVANYIVTVLL